MMQGRTCQGNEARATPGRNKTFPLFECRSCRRLGGARAGKAQKIRFGVVSRGRGHRSAKPCRIPLDLLFTRGRGGLRGVPRAPSAPGAEPGAAPAPTVAGRPRRIRPTRPFAAVVTCVIRANVRVVGRGSPVRPLGAGAERMMSAMMAGNSGSIAARMWLRSRCEPAPKVCHQGTSGVVSGGRARYAGVRAGPRPAVGARRPPAVKRRLLGSRRGRRSAGVHADAAGHGGGPASYRRGVRRSAAPRARGRQGMPTCHCDRDRAKPRLAEENAHGRPSAAILGEERSATWGGGLRPTTA